MRFSPAALREQRFKPKAAEIGIVAPVGGWNTISALAEMPEQDAYLLDNWYPSLGKVMIRKGCDAHATGVGAGAVETVAEFHHTTSRKLLAASSSNIYDATAAGAASSIKSGFTNGRWQVTQIIGNMFLCNGADTPQTYDGTTMSNWTGTGPTAANVSICMTHRHRLYVAENNSPSFWYGGSNAINGAFTEFPLSRVASLGGNIVAMGSWTVDAGDGVNDMAVFIMSSGQVVVYNGSDPGDATAWALAGIYRTGAPLSARCLVKDGADLKIITRLGIISLPKILSGEDDLTKVDGAVQEATGTASSSFGWQAVSFPKGGFLLFNIPQADGTFHQYVMNKTTGAWCRYKAIPSSSWTVYNNDLYFGGSGGTVKKAESGFDDDGNTIQADALTAWTRLQLPNRKRVAAARPIIGVTGSLTYNFGMGFDFQTPSVTDPSTIAASGADWDTSEWDVASWSPENVVQTGWKFATGTGSHISLRLRVGAETEVNWYRTDLRIEPGMGL